MTTGRRSCRWRCTSGSGTPARSPCRPFSIVMWQEPAVPDPNSGCTTSDTGIACWNCTTAVGYRPPACAGFDRAGSNRPAPPMTPVRAAPVMRTVLRWITPPGCRDAWTGTWSVCFKQMLPCALASLEPSRRKSFPPGAAVWAPVLLEPASSHGKHDSPRTASTRSGRPWPTVRRRESVVVKGHHRLVEHEVRSLGTVPGSCWNRDETAFRHGSECGAGAAMADGAGVRGGCHRGGGPYRGPGVRHVEAWCPGKLTSNLCIRP
ncbi:hypothetical protein QFZ24_009799 [Streptomyces phaeochromogenes]|nr:hypothetical protein [Streptomyces phaeochromogenes]